MNENDLKDRTKQFWLRIMCLVDALPGTTAGRAIGKQLIRSGTSVGANYRPACRGRSSAEFVAKLGIVVEEAEELTAIFVSSVRTSRSRQASAAGGNSPLFSLPAHLTGCHSL